MSELKPCPFCGSSKVEIRKNKYWTGGDYITINVTLTHWCNYPECLYKYSIILSGSTEERVTKMWNTRAGDNV